MTEPLLSLVVPKNSLKANIKQGTTWTKDESVLVQRHCTQIQD